MTTSTFERILPWSGAVAGLCWAAQLFATKKPDDPADPSAVSVISDAAARNFIAGFALLAGALMLILFAAAARRSLRSVEAAESTYSSVAHGGLLVAAVGFSTLGVVQIALTNAARAGDAPATATLGQLALIGWLPALAGLVAAFWGIGLGGLRNSAVPRWFALATVALGVVGVLGPLALVAYLLLPLWLVAAAVLTAGRPAVREPALAAR